MLIKYVDQRKSHGHNMCFYLLKPNFFFFFFFVLLIKQQKVYYISTVHFRI